MQVQDCSLKLTEDKTCFPIAVTFIVFPVQFKFSNGKYLSLRFTYVFCAVIQKTENQRVMPKNGSTFRTSNSYISRLLQKSQCIPLPSAPPCCSYTYTCKHTTTIDQSLSPFTRVRKGNSKAISSLIFSHSAHVDIAGET